MAETTKFLLIEIPDAVREVFSQGDMDTAVAQLPEGAPSLA